MTAPDPADKGKRGIDSIAHLFLSQNGKPRPSTPVNRTPPPPADDPTPPHSHVRDEDSNEPAPAEILVTAHLKHPVLKAGHYAEYLTRRGDTVQLVNIDCYEAALIRLETLQGLPRDDWKEARLNSSIVLCETEDIQNCLIPTLTEAAWECDNLLINIDPTFVHKTAELMARFSHVTVLTECNKDSIIETYQAVKKWSSHLRPDQELALFICDAPDHETADEVYYKIADTTRQFLNKVIVPAGCHVVPSAPEDSDLLEPAPGPSSEARIETPAEPDTIQPALNKSHLEDLISPVASEHPVPTESREPSPPSGSDRPHQPEPQPAPTAREESAVMASPAIHPTQHNAPASQSNPFPALFAPVRLASLPSGDTDLLQILQLNLAQWLTAIPGALTVPLPVFGQFEQPGAFLLDSNGRFHILLASLATQNNLLEAGLEYRHWFAKNRTGLMRMFPQLQFNPTLETGLILIKPSFTENQKAACRALPGLPCRPMTLCFLELPPGNALLVTPCSIE